jgi:5-methylcytosine-specific restriction protein B
MTNEETLETLNQEKIITVFENFLNDPYIHGCLTKISDYKEQRQQGRRNFEAIASIVQSGQVPTELVLLQLLPYEKSSSNYHQRAWIHRNSGITGTLKEWLEQQGWNEKETSEIAQAIFRFVKLCNHDPSQFSVACNEFCQIPYAENITTDLLSPILHALKPDKFMMIHHKSLQILNGFYQKSYTDSLSFYPETNQLGNQLIKELANYTQQVFGLPAIPDYDLFDLFCHWLFKEGHYNISNQPDTVNQWREDKLVTNPPKNNSNYSLLECAEETGVEESDLKRWVRAINRKGQAILQGPPGTGKTYLAEKLAQYFIAGGDGFWELVQFHPAYAYEDFIQGIRPKTDSQGQLTYPMVPGRFLEFCQKANKCHDICVLIIDEINRANLSSVFGELMYLLEYRDKNISLAGSAEKFKIPKNVRAIGTMNTADRSIALVDYALRRRFAFIEISPNYNALRNYHQREHHDFPVEKLITLLQQINQTMNDRHYAIGHSFFMVENLHNEISDIWQMEIEPYLEEYFFNQVETVEAFRWGKISHNFEQ